MNETESSKVVGMKEPKEENDEDDSNAEKGKRKLENVKRIPKELAQSYVIGKRNHGDCSKSYKVINTAKMTPWLDTIAFLREEQNSNNASSESEDASAVNSEQVRLPHVPNSTSVQLPEPEPPPGFHRRTFEAKTGGPIWLLKR